MAHEAVLLVGGRGTRLQPLTLTTPKPLLPLGGVAFLVHQIHALRLAGIRHVVLATSYQPDIFLEMLGDGSPFGVELTYVEEVVPLGTGGAIRHASAALRCGPEDPVVIGNGDILTGHDLAGQLADHQRRGCDVTLHLVEVDDARPFGCVPTDDSNRVTAFLEKMAEPVSRWVNAGTYVFTRSVIDSIPNTRSVSVERETFPGLLDSGAHLQAWKETAYWSDIGKPATYTATSRDVVLGRVSVAAPVVAIHPTAVVAASALIVDGSAVGPLASVGNDAVVEGSVLLDGAQVDEGARVIDSVIAQNAIVGPGVVVEGAIVGSGAVIESGNELRAGVRVWPNVRLEQRSLRFSPDG